MGESSKSDRIGDKIEIINRDRDGESKILPKSDPLPSRTLINSATLCTIGFFLVFIAL